MGDDVAVGGRRWVLWFVALGVLGAGPAKKPPAAPVSEAPGSRPVLGEPPTGAATGAPALDPTRDSTGAPAAAPARDSTGAPSLDPSVAPSADPAAAAAALEVAFTASAQPDVLLALATLYEGWEGHCPQALRAYRRFFEVCAQCAALPSAVDRFDAALARCVPDADAEIALRAEYQVPRAPPSPPRLAGDARRSEVLDVLRDARAVDPAAAGRLIVTLVEAGSDASPALLNRLRHEGWQLTLQRPAKGDEVLRLLERSQTVAPDHYEGWLGRLMFAQRARSQDKLDALRRELMDTLQAASRTTDDHPPLLGCRPNPEREWGFLTVNTKPWSEIYVNGQARGTTPVAKVRALAGCVTLRALVPVTGQAVVKNVTIRPNKNAILRLDLESGAERLSYE